MVEATEDEALAQGPRADVELLDLRPPEELIAHAEAQHRRGVRLTGLAALFVAALVLLTCAELTRGVNTRFFALGGAAVAVSALVLFAVV